MNKNILLFLLAVFFILPPGIGEAFVPQTPHLLHLMIQKIRRPAGLVVHQTRNLMDVSRAAVSEVKTPGTSIDPNLDPILDTNVEIKALGTQLVGANSIALDEKLVYVFPGKFRSDILSGTMPRFYVESDSRFIKVAGGVVSQEKSPVDFYSDPLLYRDYESLAQQLILAGVNTDQVTFQRFDNKICYFIGQPPLSQKEPVGLWIEKERLFPVRYVIEKNGWTVAFHYGKWQRVSKTWYPLQTTIFVDNQLFATIDVHQLELSSGSAPALFDVNYIQGKYPARDGFRGEGASPPIDELDKQIENFKKLYE